MQYHKLTRLATYDKIDTDKTEGYTESRKHKADGQTENWRKFRLVKLLHYIQSEWVLIKRKGRKIYGEDYF